MSDSLPIPIVMTTAGVQPQQPASLLAQLLAAVAATNPGYTANLPGSLVEDISSTAVAAIALCDAAWVELVNSLTPYGANSFILNQLAQIYGVQPGQDTNNSAYLVFSGTPGFVVSPGFTVSDGANQYIVQEGGIIASNGASALLFCVATQAGNWAMPANSIVQLITSVPTGITLSVTNPSVGLPSTAAQTTEDYRAQVLQAGLATSTGAPSLLQTALQNVAGVQARLVSIRSIPAVGYEIIVGGSGDPYQIGYVIYSSLFDLFDIVGSTLLVEAVTKANPGVVTTSLNHGYTTGQVINIAGALGMTQINNVPLTVTVLTQTTFSIGINTTSYGTYTSGGVVTPNFRNVIATISTPPDTYDIPFVVPPQQSVTMTVTWNTTATNLVSATAIAALAQPALAGYVNGVLVGAPMNLYSLESTFQTAVATILPRELMTRLLFAVYINGILTAPDSGTFIIAGDPESFFLTTAASITVNQG